MASASDYWPQNLFSVSYLQYENQGFFPFIMFHTLQGWTQNTRMRGGASGPDPELSNTGYDVSGFSRKGGEYERGSLGNCGAGEAFLKPVLGQNVRFQLNFESQFDILNAIFCFNFSLYWCCSWHTMKKKGNDLDLTKYLINDCSSFWIMRIS